MSSGSQKVLAAWRLRYTDSALQHFFKGLSAVEFGNQIVLFGAAMLISVLPLIILLSAFADRKVDEDISRRLGLNHQGSHAVDNLISSSHISFNVPIFLSLVLSFVGTIAVARSVQTIYERSFDLPPVRSRWNLPRCCVWVAGVAGLLFLDVVTAPLLLHLSAGRLVLGLFNFAVLTLFFWFSFRWLLVGRKTWSSLLPAAVVTAVFWIGLSVFSTFYFSSSLVADNRLYGQIGVVFTLTTWFIAMGAVITLGAVLGAVLQKGRRHTPADREGGGTANAS
jgi:membrane protein